MRSFFCTRLLTLRRTISRDFCDVPCRSVCSAAYPSTRALVNCASVSMPPALSNLSFRSLIMLFFPVLSRVTVKPPRVQGLIYGGAGRPAWAFGHRSPFSQICSPRFFLFFNDIGHSRGFHKNCSPWLVNTLGTAGIFQEKVPNSFGKHGEHFVEICRLYPNRPRSRKIRGEQFFISTSLCPKPVNPWGTIPVKLAPVPKPALHRPGSQPKRATPARESTHRPRNQPTGLCDTGTSPITSCESAFCLCACGRFPRRSV